MFRPVEFGETPGHGYGTPLLVAQSILHEPSMEHWNVRARILRLSAVGTDLARSPTCHLHDEGPGRKKTASDLALRALSG
ncbi:hypothetical protein Kisp02_48040 [Kineosporia sp. NBRC 101731]|nr:hypothetical protein Kisp02_48040 [Kineosporia sp. NBRC 101731]